MSTPENRQSGFTHLLQVSSRLIWVICLNVLLIVGSLFVLYRTRQVVAWILIALLVALALNPAVHFLERRRFRRGWAVLTVLLAVVGFVSVLVATVVPMIVEQGRNFVASAPGMLEKLRQSRLFQRADEHFDLIDRAKQELGSNAGAAAAPVFQLLGSMFTGVVGGVSVMVLAIFMLIFGGQLIGVSLEWIEPHRRARYLELARRIRTTVGNYVGGTLLIALMGGVVTGVTLAILQVPYFLALGLAMALLGVVPFVGSAVGGVLVVGTTFLSVGVKEGVICLVVFLVYQQVESELLQPIVQRKTIKMNALLIAVVMLLGTSLAGVLGALLALPIVAAVQVVLQDVLERRKARWGLVETSDGEQLEFPLAAPSQNLSSSAG